MAAVRLEINLQTDGLTWQSAAAAAASDDLRNIFHYSFHLQIAGAEFKILPLSVSILS